MFDDQWSVELVEDSSTNSLYTPMIVAVAVFSFLELPAVVPLFNTFSLVL
jgi:hypothetical protein